MPHYGWSGPGKMRQLDLARAKKPEIEEPTSPDVEGGESKTQLHRCGVDECGRKFKKRGLLAVHFNRDHESLREDKDSWRDYAEEVWV